MSSIGGSGWGSWETAGLLEESPQKVKLLVPHKALFYPVPPFLVPHKALLYPVPPLPTWETRRFSHSSSFTIEIDVIPRRKGADRRAKEKIFHPELFQREALPEKT